MPENLAVVLLLDHVTNNQASELAGGCEGAASATKGWDGRRPPVEASSKCCSSVRRFSTARP
jgi:hypothetical protein